MRELDAELAEYEVDVEATASERERIRAERLGWLEADPEPIAERYRSGELDVIDLVRRYGVIARLGHGRAVAADDGAVPGHAHAADGVVLGVRGVKPAAGDRRLS